MLLTLGGTNVPQNDASPLVGTMELKLLWDKCVAFDTTTQNATEFQSYHIKIKNNVICSTLPSRII